MDMKVDKNAFEAVEKYHALNRAHIVSLLATKYADRLQRGDAEQVVLDILNHSGKDKTDSTSADYAAFQVDGKTLASKIRQPPCEPGENDCNKHGEPRTMSFPDVSAALNPDNVPVMTNWEMDGNVYTIYAARVEGDTSSKILGTLSIGYLLDKEEAKKAQERLVGEVADDPAKRSLINVVLWHGDEWQSRPHVLGASDPELRDAFSRKFDAARSGNGKFDFKGVEYSLTQAELPHDPDVPMNLLRTSNPMHVRIGLVESSTERMRPIKKVQNDLYILAVCALLIAIVLGLIFSRPIVDPLVGLANVARDVEKGKYDSIQELRRQNRRTFESRDEIGTLCRAIEEMVAGLNHRRAMSKFMSQSAYSSLQDCGTCHTERKWMVILFSDIRNFTGFSEGRDPQSVVQRLNQVLGIQSEIVSKHGGDIDKFIGDAMVAWFSGDDRCQRAVNSAREIMAELAARIGDSAGGQIGVGIHVGEVIVGALGSPDRQDYTAIGSTVNLASRLCSAAKRGQILISQAVFTELGNSVPLHPLEPIRAKGFADPVQVYEVVPEAAAAAAACGNAAKATAS
jgi:class 3 adenylate cyclase